MNITLVTDSGTQTFEDVSDLSQDGKTVIFTDSDGNEQSVENVDTIKIDLG